MEITIQAIEKVMEETGLDYKAAKELLISANGDPDQAIATFKKEIPESDFVDVDGLIKKIDEKIKEVDASYIRISRGNETLLNIPLSFGLVGGLVGLASVPWALIAGMAACFGLGCKFEIIKRDGTKEEITTT